MPALVESEEEEEEDTESKDPLPEKLQNSMVTTDHFCCVFFCLLYSECEIDKKWGTERG